MVWELPTLDRTGDAHGITSTQIREKILIIYLCTDDLILACSKEIWT